MKTILSAAIAATMIAGTSVSAFAQNAPANPPAPPTAPAPGTTAPAPAPAPTDTAKPDADKDKDAKDAKPAGQ